MFIDWNFDNFWIKSRGRRKASKRLCCQIVTFRFFKVTEIFMYKINIGTYLKSNTPIGSNQNIYLTLKFLSRKVEFFSKISKKKSGNLANNCFSNKSGSLFRMTNLHNQLQQQVFSFFLLLPNNDRCHIPPWLEYQTAVALFTHRKKVTITTLTKCRENATAIIIINNKYYCVLNYFASLKTITKIALLVPDAAIYNMSWSI